MANKKEEVLKEEVEPKEEVRPEKDVKNENKKSKQEKKIIRTVSMTAQEFAKANNYKKAIAQAVVLLNPSYKEYKPKDMWKDIFEAFLIKPENNNWRDWLKQYKRRNK